MKTFLWPSIAALMAAALHGTASGEPLEAEPSAREIVERSTEATKLDAAEMTATLTIVNRDGSQRQRQLTIVLKRFDDGKTEKRLMRFVAPADVKGSSLLTYDYENESDDMWLFLPALRKTRRIVATEKSKSFMGSEFSYADVTPLSINDFDYHLVREEEAEGGPFWVIDIIPKSKKIAEESGFHKRTVYISKADNVLRRAVYSDAGGGAFKELIVREVKQIDEARGRYYPMYMTIENKQNKRRSEFKVNDLRLRKDVSDDYFTTRYLERQ